MKRVFFIRGHQGTCLRRNRPEVSMAVRTAPAKRATWLTSIFGLGWQAATRPLDPANRQDQGRDQRQGKLVSDGSLACAKPLT